MLRPQAPANLYQFLDPEESPHQIFFLYTSPPLFLPFQSLQSYNHQSTGMDTTDFLERYRQLSALDQQKNQLIEVHAISLVLGL